jgi:hypothetical protein
MTGRKFAQGIAAVASSPQAFRQVLLIDADGGPKRLAEVADHWQAADFQALDPAWLSIAGHEISPPFRRGWLERPRGHSKTGDIAAMVAWALFASRRRLSGVVAAADQDQAALIRDAISKLLALNEWLAPFVEVQRGRVIGLRDGREHSELKILSADAPSSYGLTPDFIVCDEVTHWTKRDLWDSLFSAAAKRANCLLVSICNAGFEQSWQWPLREAIRVDPAWYFHALDGPQASWISPALLEEQRRLLPAIAYRRLWLNRWSSGSGDAIEESAIDAACVLSSPPAGPEKGWMYIAGVDLGIRRDASAIAVLGKHVGYTESIPREPKPAQRSSPLLNYLCENDEELALTNSECCEYRFIEGTGKTRLAALNIFRPGANGGNQTVDVGEIEACLIELHARFNLQTVGCDPHQAAYLIQRLQQVRVPAEPVDFVGSNLKAMAEATMSAFTERLIELWPEPSLLADLRNLRVVEKSYGVRLESPRKSGGEGTRHGDTATALSIALHVARRFAFSPPAIANNGAPLLCWP